MSEEEGVIKRVPPPPPPGFGDEEYYRLYGRPEEYHRYRQKLATSLKNRRHHEGSRPPQRRASSHNPSSSSYRSHESRPKGPPFNSYEEEYEHFYGRKASRAPSEEEGTPELSSSEDEDDEEDEDDNSDDDGSESEEGSEGEVFDESDEERRKKSRSRRPEQGPSPKKKYENFRVTIPNESEGTPSLSEEEENRGFKRNRSPIRPSPRPKGKSVKDRLGVRVRPPSPPNPPPNASSSSSSSRRRRRRRRRSSSEGRNESQRSDSGKRHSSKRRRSEGKNNNNNSVEDDQQPSQSKLSKKMESANKENELMLKRLARRRKGRSEQDQVKSLARLAGVDLPRESSRSVKDRRRKDSSKENDERRNGKRSPARKSRFGSGVLASQRKNRRGRSPPERGMESETHRRADRLLTRSPEEKKPKKSDQKWQHDKFKDMSASPIEVENDSKELEGSHWKRIRSERSKERERNDKRRSRSTSKRRSRRRRKRGDYRKRRRGTYSRSSSRSSSSSRSRSSFSRSYSRSSSRSDRSLSSFSSSSSGRSSSSSKSSKDSYLRSRRRPRHHRSLSPRNGKDMRPSDKPSTSAESQKPQDPPVITIVDEKQQPDFGLTGKLTQETNTVNGVVVKYSEPPDSRRPKTKWRLYVFKGNEELPILYIHRQSSYLLGRDRKVADVPLDHPSCSKQHAALQYRLVEYVRPDGSKGRRVSPYIIDLNSANGTFINNKKIDPQKFVQVLEKDVLKFGFSSREYVLLHDQSNDTEDDDLGVD